MSDIDGLKPLLAFLAAPDGTASAEQVTAWEDLYRALDPMIRKVIKRCDCSQIDTDDLAQCVWYIVVRRLRTFDPARGTLRNWVLAIARNLAGKNARRRSRIHDEAITEQLVAALLAHDEGPMTDCQGKEQQEQVRAILAKFCASLPELSRQIAEMRLIEERTVAAIAAALHVSEDCVKMRLRAVCAELRDLLRRAGFGQSEKK